MEVSSAEESIIPDNKNSTEWTINNLGKENERKGKDMKYLISSGSRGEGRSEEEGSGQDAVRDAHCKGVRRQSKVEGRMTGSHHSLR